MKIQIGFKAFDPHELLCHFVTLQSGLYQQENIEVELVDITFMDDNALPETMSQFSCGAALAASLKGKTQHITLVACDSPMFWLYGGKDLGRVEELVDRKIATFPVVAPPHHLANIIIKKHGIDPEQELQLFAARDDAARLGLLNSGNVDAAVISSAISPVSIARLGLNRLVCFGDELRIPTTGLATQPAFLEKEAALFETLVSIYRQSLSMIKNDAGLVASVLEKYFFLAGEDSRQTAESYAPYFTEDGRISAEIAESAIAALCNSFSISPAPDWKDIYHFPA